MFGQEDNGERERGSDEGGNPVETTHSEEDEVGNGVDLERLGNVW